MKAAHKNSPQNFRNGRKHSKIFAKLVFGVKFSLGQVEKSYAKKIVFAKNRGLPRENVEEKTGFGTGVATLVIFRSRGVGFLFGSF